MQAQPKEPFHIPLLLPEDKNGKPGEQLLLTKHGLWHCCRWSRAGGGKRQLAGLQWTCYELEVCPQSWLGIPWQVVAKASCLLSHLSCPRKSSPSSKNGDRGISRLLNKSRPMRTCCLKICCNVLCVELVADCSKSIEVERSAFPGLVAGRQTFLSPGSTRTSTLPAHSQARIWSNWVHW